MIEQELPVWYRGQSEVLRLMKIHLRPREVGIDMLDPEGEGVKVPREVGKMARAMVLAFRLASFCQ